MGLNFKKAKIFCGVEGKLKANGSLVLFNGLIHPQIENKLRNDVELWESLPEVFRVNEFFQIGGKITWLPLTLQFKEPFLFDVKKDVKYIDINIEFEARVQKSILIGDGDTALGAKIKGATTQILKYKIRKGVYSGYEVYSKIKFGGYFFIKFGLKKIKVFDLSIGYSEKKRELEVVCAAGMGLELGSYGLDNFPIEINASLEGKVILKFKYQAPDNFDDLSDFHFPEDGPIFPINPDDGDDDLDLVTDLFDEKINYKKKINLKLNPNSNKKKNNKPPHKKKKNKRKKYPSKNKIRKRSNYDSGGVANLMEELNSGFSKLLNNMKKGLRDIFEKDDRYVK